MLVALGRGCRGSFLWAGEGQRRSSLRDVGKRQEPPSPPRAAPTNICRAGRFLKHQHGGTSPTFPPTVFLPGNNSMIVSSTKKESFLAGELRLVMYDLSGSH